MENEEYKYKYWETLEILSDMLECTKENVEFLIEQLYAFELNFFDVWINCEGFGYCPSFDELISELYSTSYIWALDVLNSPDILNSVELKEELAEQYEIGLNESDPCCLVVNNTKINNLDELREVILELAKLKGIEYAN